MMELLVMRLYLLIVLQMRLEILIGDFIGEPLVTYINDDQWFTLPWPKTDRLVKIRLFKKGTTPHTFTTEPTSNSWLYRKWWWCLEFMNQDTVVREPGRRDNFDDQSSLFEENRIVIRLS